MTFENYLRQIVNDIDDQSVQGIARKAIDIGFEGLTDRQKYTLEEGISDFIMSECPYCEDEINYEDMQFAIHNGKCSFCEHRWNKMQAE